MRFYPITTAIMSAFMLVACSFPARADNPAFALSFRLDPPLALNAAPPPVFYLDACASPDCSQVIKSIAMNCSIQPVQSNMNGIVGCMVEAVSQPSYPDPNMQLLNHPANLRVRANSLMSQSFPFNGGQPAVPQVFYNFVITPGINGFSVSPG